MISYLVSPSLLSLSLSLPLTLPFSSPPRSLFPILFFTFFDPLLLLLFHLLPSLLPCPSPLFFLINLVFFLLLSRDQYSFSVEAVEVVEGEVVTGVGSALVNVTVTDANDHAPQFMDTPYQFEVFENVSIGTLIGSVSASDTDGSDSEVGVVSSIFVHTLFHVHA